MRAQRATITKVTPSKVKRNVFYIEAQAETGDIRFISKKEHRVGDEIKVTEQRKVSAYDPIVWKEI